MAPRSDDADPRHTAPTANDRGLPADADIPDRLRPVIERAARRQCADAEVTPALIAAMLKAESNFDPTARRTKTDEYGIAMWSPELFKSWALDGDQDGRKSYMDADDAILTMAKYLCWLDQDLKKAGFRSPAQLPSLIAASYRTSQGEVINYGGVQPEQRAYVAQVRRNLDRYTQ